MKEGTDPKNVYYSNGVKYYKRWTVLDVEADTVETIKLHSGQKKITTGKALDELIIQSVVNNADKEIIGLDYWQVISHYPKYFKEFASQMLAAGHEIHIITAVGEERSKVVFNDINKTRVPHTKKHMVIFKDPKESPELKLAKCKELGITTFYDDRDDVVRLLNKNGIVAMRVTRKDNSTYDLEAEQT